VQVLRVTVKLRPGVHRFSANGWWSGWVLCHNGKIFDASPSCRFWLDKETSEFMHWCICAGGDSCWSSKYEEQ
jgi:hypothetical protein